MNLVILLAGSSEIFMDKGQKYPKSLVEIQGRAVIDRVVENLKPKVMKFGTSSGMVLAADSNGEVIVLDLNENIKNGSKVK